MLNILFWVAMAGVLVLGWPEFKAWLAVRKLRKEIKQYEAGNPGQGTEAGKYED